MALQLTQQHQRPRYGLASCRQMTFASALFALLCVSSFAEALDQHQQSLHLEHSEKPKAALLTLDSDNEDDVGSLAATAATSGAVAHNHSSRNPRGQGHSQELLSVEEVADATSTRGSAPVTSSNSASSSADVGSHLRDIKDSLVSRIKSPDKDWTRGGGLSQVLLMPAMAALLAWAIHHPEHASWKRSGKLSLEDSGDLKNVASIVPVLVCIALIAILPSLWLGNGSADPDSRQMLWATAQTPLMFVVLGYGIACQNPPNCLRLGVVAAMVYIVLLVILTLLPEDGSMGLETGVTTLDFFKSLLPKLLPIEVLSAYRLSGMAQIVANVGALAVCLLFTPGLLSLARGASNSGLFYIWLLSALTCLADYDSGILSALMDPVSTTIVGRLQLPAFVAGIILSSWPRPELKMRLLGLGLLTAYCFSWKLSLSPLYWQYCYRGLFLPLQLPMVWSLMDLLSVPHVGRFYDGRSVKLPDTLPVSFGAVLMLPVLAERQPLGGPLYSICAALVAMLLLHTLEWALWFATAFMEPTEMEEEHVSITPEPKLVFFGRFFNEDVFRNRLPFRAFQAIAYYAFFASAVLTIYYQAEFDATHTPYRFDAAGTILPSLFVNDVINGIVRELGWCTTGLCALVCLWTTTGQLLAAPTWRCQAPTAKELQDETPSTMVLCFRYCTRGLNPTLVASNVEHVYRVLELSGLKKDTWRLEVVTDNPLGLSALAEKGVDCAETLVPNYYKCPNGGKYKARAMHWAISNSAVKLQHTDWICHLDEETYFDRHSVCSIYQHCLRENAAVAAGVKAFPDMGQGTILYNTFGLRPETLLTALADTARVGDDIGKFRLQYLGFNTASMGMHGSFAVINQKVEEVIGFDFGSEGSITEDSYFAMKAQMGINLGMQWIDGYMFEQSPFSVMDLIHQRGRWFHGLFFCTWFGGQGFPFRMTALLSFMMGTWTLSFCVLTMNILIKVFHLFGTEDYNLVFASNTVSLIFKLNYMLGFVHTFSPFLEGWAYWLALFYMQITIIPIAVGAFETAGVLNGLYLLLSRESVFYIVQKEKKATIGKI